MLLLVTRTGSGTPNGGLLSPLLDLVTLEGVAVPVGSSGSLAPEVLRFPGTLELPPPLQVCLREVVGGGRGGDTPMGVGGREMEYDL